MSQRAMNISDLLHKHLRNELDAAEAAALQLWLNGQPENKLLLEAMEDEEKVRENLARLQSFDLAEGKRRLALKQKQFARKRVVQLYRTVAAAAVIAAVVSTGAWLWLHPQPATPPLVYNKVADPAPGFTKATLTLADGSVVTLDSAGQRVIQQGIRQQGGQLSYTAASQDAGYNTVTTPRGGSFRISLADGTGVWLNAESSVRFPAAFTGKQRKVEVKGEVYFEVAKDAAKPFIVAINPQLEVQVLGTRFNINAYTNESSINTTLLDGAVSVVHDGIAVRLTPGQQAQAAAGTKVLDNVDVEKVMAWKNGYFNFEGVGIKELMRQLERWYDIDVVYEKGVPDIVFAGKMSMNVHLSDLLGGLAGMGVHFRLEEGRRLIVLPD